MLFRKNDLRDGSLEPFAIQLGEGFLVGMAVAADFGAPCKTCVLNWLLDRKVAAKPVSLEAVKHSARIALDQALKEQSPHVLFETTPSGQINRLECLVFPHPKCQCHRGHFVPPMKVSEGTNMAFSPIYQIKCVRFGTPEGNVWKFSATGPAPKSGKMVTAFSAHSDKETARLDVIDAWLKKSADSDRENTSEPIIPSEDFFSGKLSLSEPTKKSNEFKGIGVGVTKEEAALDALYGLARLRTVRQYSQNAKNPMLIVGANSWIRKRVPYFLLQQYDLYLMFYSNNSPSWVMGLAAFSRTSTNASPIFVFSANSNPISAMEDCTHKILEFCKPSDWRKEEPDFHFETKRKKLNMWWTHWIYRCPKISLKDVTQLEPHPRSLEVWRHYLQSEGLTHISLQHLNHDNVPVNIRSLVKLDIENLQVDSPTNVIQFGVGTWSNFRESATQV